MEYVVLRTHTFTSERGRTEVKSPGDLVNVDRRKTARALLAQGIIALEQPLDRVHRLPMAVPANARVRVGCFMHTSAHYSGGRIHMYQIAWTLANLGSDVFILTDRNPRWRVDYPEHENLRIVISDGPPQDFDVILTDGKSNMGEVARKWKRDHPLVPLVVLNFETPNWVAKFDKDSAARMPDVGPIVQEADLVLVNSDESAKFLRQHVKFSAPVMVSNPAANDSQPIAELPPRERPYIVWSARGSKYKGADVVVKTWLNSPMPLDLVMIGQPGAVPGGDRDHDVVTFDQPPSDAEKMAWFKGAACVAAPSKFEGFGMVPSEALINGTPVVAYDLPVLRQNYGDRIIYAKWGDANDFARKLYATIKSRPAVDAEEAKKTFGMKAMEKQIATVPFLSRRKDRRHVSAQMIAYYGASTVIEAIESVYPHVDELFIMHGPTPEWKDFPEDGTLAKIKAFADPDKKLRVEARDVWKDKREMREWALRRMTGDFMLIVDADEIYDNLGAWIERAPDFGCPRWMHFWHDVNHYVVDAPGDARWGKPHALGGTVHNHLRWAFWRRSNYFQSMRGTGARDRAGNPISTGEQTNAAVAAVPECCIYHFGHVFDARLMKAKHEYYLSRDGVDAGRLARKEAWHKWNGKLGPCGDGIIKKVECALPPLVVRAWENVNAGR